MAAIILGWIADVLTLDVVLYELWAHRSDMTNRIHGKETTTHGP